MTEITRKINRVMFSAPKSGSGKTLITCACLAALKAAGYPVSSVKSGPDYIDPLFHKEVLGIPARNLDTYFTDHETTRALLAEDRRDGEYVVMEGVMGLFDGAGGTERMGSSYDLAEATKTPIILVLDAKGAGFSILPIIAGFLQYDTAKLIRGVILNRTSGVMAERLRPFIEDSLGVKLVGYFPNQKDIAWESRYLGLTLPGEIAGVQETIRIAADAFTKNIPLKNILQIMENAPALTAKPLREAIYDRLPGAAENEQGVRIAVARDEGFCFYYEENMQILRRLGAEIVPFSPIHDEKLPEDIDGILLGGGYPENYLKELEENRSMRSSLREAVLGKMPLRAECGGFMVLHERIFDKEGVPHEMVGAVRGECRYTGKSQRFGYIEVAFPETDGTGGAAALPAGAAPGSGTAPEGMRDRRIKGHEFHYYDSTNNGEDCTASKPVTGKTYRCMQVRDNAVMGYPHFYYPSGIWFAEEYVRQAAKYRKERLGEKK